MDVSPVDHQGYDSLTSSWFSLEQRRKIVSVVYCVSHKYSVYHIQGGYCEVLMIKKNDLTIKDLCSQI